MIRGVLDMQEKEVCKIMKPRVEIIAVEETDTVADILAIATEFKYSRIPVYRGSIDHIVGVVFSKDLLDFIQIEGGNGVGSEQLSNAVNSGSVKLNSADTTERKDAQNKPTSTSTNSKQQHTTTTTTPSTESFNSPTSWHNLTAAKLMEGTYYIPETMSCWTALQEMRKRR